MVGFFSCWLVRNTSSPAVVATEIVSTIVTKSVNDFVEFIFIDYINSIGCGENIRDASGPLYYGMSHVDWYLRTHTDLLSKKFIIFTHNSDNIHWWGWVAINSLYQISKTLKLREDL